MITNLQKFSVSIEKVGTVIENGIHILKQFEKISEADEIEKLYQERKKFGLPSIMLFGIYNSGKSSLLNALLGEEITITGDKPETSKVTKYPWRNNLTLIDTPGIDAPLDHEEITNEQILNSDVVLFLVSDDSPADDKKIWSEIKRLNDLKKSVIFIINDKKGYLNSSDKEEAKKLLNIREKFIERAEKELGKTIHVMLVNAQRALKGKKDGKELLIVNSNIDNLESYIVQYLQKVDLLEILKTPLQKLEIYLNQIEKELNIKIDGNKGDYEKAVTYLNDLKSKLKNEGHLLAEKRILPVKNSIVSIMKNSMNNPDIDPKPQIENVIDEQIKNVVVQFEEKSDLIKAEAQEEYQELVKTTIHLISDVDPINSFDKPDPILTEKTTLNYSELNKMIPFNQVETLVFEGLKNFSTKPRFMGKGRWFEKLGSQAKTITMGLQIIFSIATMAIDINRDIKEIERQKRAREEFLFDINNNAVQVVNNIIEEITHEMDIAINNSFKAVFDNLSKDKSESDKNSKDLISKSDYIQENIELVKITINELNTRNVLEVNS